MKQRDWLVALGLFFIFAAFVAPIGYGDSANIFWVEVRFATVEFAVVVAVAIWVAIRQPNGVLSGLALSGSIALAALAPLRLLSMRVSYAVFELGTEAPGLWLALLGLACLIFSFFCLLTALSWGDASLVAPASASLTFITSAILAKFFLHENVDRRRWISAALVCIGVLLLVQ